MAEPSLDIERKRKGKLAREVAERIGASIGVSGSQQYYIKAAPESNQLSDMVIRNGSAAR